MLGAALLNTGAITQAQLEQALAQQRTSGALLGEILLSLNFITEEALARALAREAGVPFVTIDGLRPDPAAVALVPEHFARQHVLAPVAFKDTALEVLQANPFDVLALDELRRLVGRPINVSCGTAQDVRNLIERCYTDRSDLDRWCRRAWMPSSAPDVHVATEDSPVVRLLELVINDAIAKGATDLHVEPEDQSVRIRYRIDGVLIPGDTIPKELHAPLVSRLKVLGGLDITEQRLPQDGRISQMVNGRRVDLRVATFPTTFGEKVAIRILEKEKLVRGLTELGFSKQESDAVPRHPQQVARHRPRDRSDRRRQDDDALFGAGASRQHRAQHPDRRRSGRVPDPDDPADADPAEGGVHVRDGDQVAAAAGPGRHHDRRDPRSRDRAARAARGAVGHSRVQHAAHAGLGRRRARASWTWGSSRICWRRASSA